MAYETNYRPPDIWIPIARKVPLVMNPFVVPYAMRGQVSGIVQDATAAKEIGHAFGRDTLIDQPFMVASHGARAVVMTEGVTEAAELEDLALEALDRQEERAKNDWVAQERERKGFARREDFPQMFSDALQERIARHKRNPVTDPPRVPKKHTNQEEPVRFYT
jgi:hypothetical protein